MPQPGLKGGAVLTSVVIGVSGALAQTPAPQRLGPCEKITAACKTAGFIQGGAAEGKGLWADCVIPLMQGKARPAPARPLPTIAPQLKAACLEAQPDFGKLGSEPSAGKPPHPTEDDNEGNNNSDTDNGRSRATAKERALASWQAMKRWFGDSGPNYPNIFATGLPGPRGQVRPGYVWGQGQVAHAALDIARLTNDYREFNRIAPALSRYLLTNWGTTAYAPGVDPRRFSPPPPRWWDDNGVTGLVLLQAYDQLGASGGNYLQMVRNLWPFFKAGQRPGGGQNENETPSGQILSLIATSSDDQNVEHLYLAANPAGPQRSEYLNFILANDAAVKAKLRSPGGLYWDGYHPDIQKAKWKWCDGTLNKGVCSGTWWACNHNRKDLLPPQQLPTDPHVCAWMFPYTQGFMIGSDVLLYRITGDSKYLQSAIRTANAALGYYTPESLWRGSAAINAGLFLGLFQLDQYAHNPRTRASLEAYLERAWNEVRDPETGLFNRGGLGIYNRRNGISPLDQSAWVTMYSLLASPPHGDLK